MKNKNIYIETLGCSKNQVDSEKMIYILEENGYKIIENPEKAENIIINTCCFIKPAKEEAIETIFELARYKKEGKCKKLIVAGCMAQYYSSILKDEIPEIDVIFGIGDLKKVIDAIDSKDGIILPIYSLDSIHKRKILSYPGSGYLKISDGCSNHCSYCIIPLIRGELKSREIYDILKEIEFLAENNIKEIILIAQDTANYGMDVYNKRMLGKLILQIDNIVEKGTWLRVLYMHPDHIDRELLIKLKKTKNFIPYFDIPFQSGSDKILKKMNRQGTGESYLELIENIRRSFDEVILRSTFITGFPGETSDDFNATLNFIKEAKLDWVGGFTYSREESSDAGTMKDQIDEKIKQKRLTKLLTLTDKIFEERIQRFIGTTQNILIEERVSGEDLYIGRFWGQAPDVDGLTVVDSAKAKPGEFIKAEIKKLNNKDFYAIG